MNNITNESQTNEPIEETLIRFIKAGIHINKIFITKNSSICYWSLTKSCVFDRNYIEIVDNEITNKNNIIVALLVRTKLTKDNINEINNSSGIIITNVTYGKSYFRYGFVPTYSN